MRLRAPLTIVAAALLCGSPVSAQEAPRTPVLNLCTGTVGNNYHRAGQKLRAKLEGNVDVQVIATQGSWENLEAIDRVPRRCDAIIAQDDAWALYQFEKPNSQLTMDRMATLYPEYVHLLCNRRRVTVDDVAQLDPTRHKVLVNQYGSGTYITWSLFGRLNRAHARLPTAEVAINEGLLKVADGIDAQCMVFVSGLGAGSLETAEKLGDKLKLLTIVDKQLQRPVGRERRAVYTPAKVPTGTYKGLLDADIATQTVDAVFFVSPEWKARYPKAAKALATALIEIIPELQKKAL